MKFTERLTCSEKRPYATSLTGEWGLGFRSRGQNVARIGDLYTTRVNSFLGTRKMFMEYAVSAEESVLNKGILGITLLDILIK